MPAKMQKNPSQTPRPHGLLSDSFQLPFLLQPNILVIAALNAHFAKRKQQKKGEEGNEGSLYKLDAEINSCAMSILPLVFDGSF